MTVHQAVIVRGVVPTQLVDHLVHPLVDIQPDHSEILVASVERAREIVVAFLNGKELLLEQAAVVMVEFARFLTVDYSINNGGYIPLRHGSGTRRNCCTGTRGSGQPP